MLCVMGLGFDLIRMFLNYILSRWIFKLFEGDCAFVYLDEFFSV